VLLGGILSNIHSITAQVRDNTIKIDEDNQHKITKNYGCYNYGDTEVIYCDRSTYNVQSYDVAGDSIKLYNASNNTPSYDNDTQQGKAAHLDPRYTESIILSDKLLLNTSGFSVSFWVKPSEQNIPADTISYRCLKCFPPSGWYFDIKGVNQSLASIGFNIYNSSGVLFTAGKEAEVTISYDLFTHIVGTFDGSNVRIFRNGILAAQTVFHGIYNNTNSVRVGTDFYGTYPLKVGIASYCNACYQWKGSIDDLRLYSKPLELSEVKYVYSKNNSNSDSYISNLIGHWKFDGNLNDSTENNNPGKISTLIASMAFAPDGRLFFSEKNTGNIRIMKDDEVFERPFATISDSHIDYEQGLLGLAIDPLFKKNHYVYLYYTAVANNTINNDNNKIVNRVVRFTDVNNTAVDKVTLLDNIPALAGYHSGGALAFGPDDKLYITVGDATNSVFAQSPSVLLGKVLRINRDGTIPADNPYPGLPVYTIGHRNMYGIAFNKDGFGIVTENGASLYDEINVIKKGGNYGYPTLQPPDIPPEASNFSSGVKPLRSYKFIIAPTQAIFYDGDKMPELENSLLFGSLNGAIHVLNISNYRKQIIETRINLHLFPFEGVIAIAQSPSGEVYYGDHSIYKLKSIDQDKKSQVLFPVQINSTLNASLANVESVDDKDVDDMNKLIMTLDINKVSGDTTGNTSDFLNIKMPKGIMSTVNSVSILNNQDEDEDEVKEEESKDITSQGKELDFTVDDSYQNFAIVNLPVDDISFDDSTRVLIFGDASTRQ
jgi:glucose/arabinose dehydrogenase